MSEFKSKVIKTIISIPFGKVASYGQIAAIIGIPRAARQVGWILNRSENDHSLPWWRVINNSGKITIKGSMFNDANTQRELLIAENIKVSEDYTLDINKYRFQPNLKLLNELQLTEDYIQLLLNKYNQ